MSNKPKVHIREGNGGIIHTDVGVYAYSAASTSDNWVELLENASSSMSWESDPVVVNGVKLVPYGQNNRLPVEIRGIMDENNLAPGILEREMGLLYGQGPHLYETKYKENDVVKEWKDDKEVWDWLKSWDYYRFIEMAMVDYKHLKGYFYKYRLNKGYSRGFGKKPKIASMEVEPAKNARLEWVDSRRLADVKIIYTGNFEHAYLETQLKGFPVYDRMFPFKNAISMGYSCSYSFARDFYPVPGFFGSLNWIKRSSDIPQIIKYLTDNMLGISFVVHSPAGYWDEKRSAIERKYPEYDEDKVDEKLESLKTETFKKVSEVLAGKKNVGKYIEVVDFYDEAGNLQKWSIEAVDQKVKDFIDAQINVSKKADAATTSGIGLHPALSNIMVDGKLSSGSEMLYALKLYLASDVSIPEEIIMRAINEAIRVNFPEKNLKLGFYHKVVLREEDVSTNDRMTNKV